MQLKISVKLQLFDEQAFLPIKEFPDSAGYDLRIPGDAVVPAHSGSTIPLGFGVELPVGVGMFPFSRSGVCIKGVQAWPSRIAFEEGCPSRRYDCKICLGLIDADYRGECAIILDNDDSEFYLPYGACVCQCVFLPVLDADFSLCDQLSPSLRGKQGFNS